MKDDRDEAIDNYLDGDYRMCIHGGSADTLPKEAPYRDASELSVPESQEVRTSYSAMTCKLNAGPALQSDDLLYSDEDPAPGEDESAAAAEAKESGGPQVPAEASYELDAEAYPMARMLRGRDFGTAVHAALECFVNSRRFSSDEADCEQLAIVAAEQFAGGMMDASDLAKSISYVVSTKLGGPFGDRSILDFSAVDMRAELDFDFGLNAGLSPAAIGRIAAKWSELVPPGNPAHEYGAHLRAKAANAFNLSGTMTGSIDLFLRDSDGGFYVIDWKTNAMRADEVPHYEDFTVESLSQEMIEADYYLQALVYSVAAARIARSNGGGAESVKGAGYLFVRGMGSPLSAATKTNADGSPLGVIAWRPPATLIDFADRVFAGIAEDTSDMSSKEANHDE